MGMGPTEGWSATATSHTSWALPLKLAKAAAWSLTQWSGAVPLSGIYNTTTQVRSRLWPSPWLDFASQQHPTGCPNMVCVPNFITNNSTGHVFKKLFSHHDCAAICCTTLWCGWAEITERENHSKEKGLCTPDQDRGRCKVFQGHEKSAKLSMLSCRMGAIRGISSSVIPRKLYGPSTIWKQREHFSSQSRADHWTAPNMVAIPPPTLILPPWSHTTPKVKNKKVVLKQGSGVYFHGNM